jgi:hypothetical protein
LIGSGGGGDSRRKSKERRKIELGAEVSLSLTPDVNPGTLKRRGNHEKRKKL